MPTKKQVFEHLKFELAAHPENGNQKAFYDDVEKSQAERNANGKRKERFVLVTHDPDLCARFEVSKDRIVKRVGNVAVSLDLMCRTWEESLSNGEIDRILAQEGPE